MFPNTFAVSHPCGYACCNTAASFGDKGSLETIVSMWPAPYDTFTRALARNQQLNSSVYVPTPESVNKLTLSVNALFYTNILNTCFILNI